MFHVPLASSVDGVEVTITVRAADKFNNPVADGTSAIFTTEYGAIDGSCLTGVSNGARYQALVSTAPPLRGTCAVLWVSQDPKLPIFRPDLVRTIDTPLGYDCLTHSGSDGPCPVDLGAIRGMRSTVQVTMEGDESFVDSNGNSVYDDGEPFENLPEAFLDNNEDLVFTPAIGPNCPPPTTEENCIEGGFEETFVDKDGNLEYSENVDPNTGEGWYNGSLCPPEGDGVFCSRELITTRSSLVLTLSSSVASQFAQMVRTNITPDQVTGTARENTPHEMYIADIFNNRPGTGSTITLEASGDCQFVGPDTDTITRTVLDNGGAPGAFIIPFEIEDRFQSDDAMDPNPDDDGIGSIFVTGTDAGDGGGTSFIATFNCQTLGCVDSSGSLLSPAPFGCPTP